MSARPITYYQWHKSACSKRQLNRQRRLLRRLRAGDGAITSASFTPIQLDSFTRECLQARRFLMLELCGAPRPYLPVQTA